MRRLQGGPWMSFELFILVPLTPFRLKLRGGKLRSSPEEASLSSHQDAGQFFRAEQRDEIHVEFMGRSICARPTAYGITWSGQNRFVSAYRSTLICVSLIAPVSHTQCRRV